MFKSHDYLYTILSDILIACNNLYKLYYEYLALMLEYYNIYFVIKTINNNVLYLSIDSFVMTDTSIISQYKIVKVCISCHNNVN